MHKFLMGLLLLAFTSTVSAGTLYWQLDEVDNPFEDTSGGLWGNQKWTTIKLYKTGSFNGVESVNPVLVTSSDNMEEGGYLTSYIDNAYKTSGDTFYVELWNSTWAIARTKTTDNSISSYIALGQTQPTAGYWTLTDDDFESVPEPTGGMLVLFGLAMFGLKRKVQKRA